MARTCLLRWAICQASMRQRGDGAHDELVFEPPDDLEPALQRFVVERAMGACARLLRDVLGSGLELAGCTLRYGAPPPGAAPARPLGARVRYHAQDNVLRLAHAHLLQPLPQANAVTAAMCERLCAQLLQRRRTRIDTTALVREHLAGLPPGQTASVPGAATTPMGEGAVVETPAGAAVITMNPGPAR